MSSGFVHLHVHSQFSFMDGAAPLPALVARAAELEMPALALTDHQGLSGAIRFYQACHAAGIRPIVGCEVVVEAAGILGSEADLPPERRLGAAGERGLRARVGIGAPPHAALPRLRGLPQPVPAALEDPPAQAARAEHRELARSRDPRRRAHRAVRLPERRSGVRGARTRSGARPRSASAALGVLRPR